MVTIAFSPLPRKVRFCSLHNARTMAMMSATRMMMSTTRMMMMMLMMMMMMTTTMIRGYRH